MKICEWCKSEFEPAVKTRMYCSNKCSSQATASKRFVKKEKIVKTKKCKECGNEYAPKASEFSRSIFCGRKCSTEHAKRQRKGKPCKKNTVPLTSGRGRVSVYAAL